MLCDVWLAMGNSQKQCFTGAESAHNTIAEAKNITSGCELLVTDMDERYEASATGCYRFWSLCCVVVSSTTHGAEEAFTPTIR
jgi:hypothetical protein